MNIESFWLNIVEQATEAVESEPLLSNLYRCHLIEQPSLGAALSNILASRLFDTYMPASQLEQLFNQEFAKSTSILHNASRDIQAVCERDPAVSGYPEVLLYLKGFMALQGYRVTHQLWQDGRHHLRRL